MKQRNVQADKLYTCTATTRRGTPVTALVFGFGNTVFAVDQDADVWFTSCFDLTGTTRQPAPGCGTRHGCATGCVPGHIHGSGDASDAFRATRALDVLTVTSIVELTSELGVRIEALSCGQNNETHQVFDKLVAAGRRVGAGDGTWRRNKASGKRCVSRYFWYHHHMLIH
ncbi:hypothetical protein FHG87_014454 [Trinorchestia longiramus]|nr:hypothetical protein FHG87_014454 [Trinorchestia longiramus]